MAERHEILSRKWIASPAAGRSANATITAAWRTGKNFNAFDPSEQSDEPGQWRHREQLEELEPWAR